MGKAVVTGGAGFIGSHIVGRLLKSGYEVTVIDDLSAGKKENIPAEADFHQLDIRSKECAELLADLRPDLLVHTAAQMSVRLSMEDPVFDADVNVVGLLNILHSFQGKNFPHIVFLSTGGAIYGEQEAYPAPEAHPIAPASVYGLAKRVGEMYLDLWHREYGLNYTALRLANVYGPRQNPHGEAGVVAIFCQKLFGGETPTINGNGEQTRDFVFVEDVAAAAEAVATKGISGIYNIGTGKETSVNELYEGICKATTVMSDAQYAPAKEGEQMRSCIDSAQAKIAFGWEPAVNLQQGLQQTAEYFNSKMAGMQKQLSDSTKFLREDRDR